LEELAFRFRSVAGRYRHTVIQHCSDRRQLHVGERPVSRIERPHGQLLVVRLLQLPDRWGRQCCAGHDLAPHSGASISAIEICRLQLRSRLLCARLLRWASFRRSYVFDPAATWYHARVRRRLWNRHYEVATHLHQSQHIHYSSHYDWSCFLVHRCQNRISVSSSFGKKSIADAEIHHGVDIRIAASTTLHHGKDGK